MCTMSSVYLLPHRPFTSVNTVSVFLPMMLVLWSDTFTSLVKTSLLLSFITTHVKKDQLYSLFSFSSAAPSTCWDSTLNLATTFFFHILSNQLLINDSNIRRFSWLLAMPLNKQKQDSLNPRSCSVF